MSYITCSHCHCGFENRSGLDNHIGLVHYKPLLQAPLYTHPPLYAKPPLYPQPRLYTQYLHAWSVCNLSSEKHENMSKKDPTMLDYELHWNMCEYTSQDMILLNMHMQGYHAHEETHTGDVKTGAHLQTGKESHDLRFEQTSPKVHCNHCEYSTTT